MRKSVVAATLAVLVLFGSRAHAADTLDTFGYVIPTGLSTLALAVNSTYIAYDEPAPRAWRIFGWASGAAEVVAGGVVFATGGSDSETIVLGTLALGLGAAAITTAFVVSEEHPLTIAPVVEPHGAALVIAGRF